MIAKEEIEAAVERFIRPTCSYADEPRREWPERRILDAESLASEFIEEYFQQRERDQPPTREMFSQCFNAKNDSLDWVEGDSFPVLFLYDDEAKLDTIAKLRAACLLLGIDTEGVL